MAQRRRRVPAPLAGLLVIALIQAFAWAVVLPAFEAPDEESHFGAVQRNVETRSINWTAIGTEPPWSSFSTEEIAARGYSAVSALAFNPAMRPWTSSVDERRWDGIAARLGDAQRSDGGSTAAMANPPLYYLYEALFYAPLEHSDIFTRVFVMRLGTALFLLVAVLAAWMLAGEVFGRRRWLQVLTAGVVALQPMLGQLSGIVNPDAMIAAEFAVALWLAAAIVNRGVSRWRLAGALGLIVAGALTHGRALPVAVPLVLAVAIRLWPAAVERGRRARAAALAGAGLAVVIALGASLQYTLRGDVTVDRARQFVSYVWQFYLPRPSFMTPSPGPKWGVRDVFVDRLWSGFGQLDVNIAPGLLPWVGRGTLLLVVAAAIAVVVAVVRGRRAPRVRPLALLVAVSSVALVWSLHVAAWRDLQLYGDPILTGRYVVPLLPVAGLGLAAIAVSLPRRVGPALGILVLGAELALALAALGATVVRFYV
ncbi:MAG TPA: hypothetical protein VFT50_06360 [Baekduia sp.]|nr:hypothetical protein [Baekduia sp.]